MGVKLVLLWLGGYLLREKAGVSSTRLRDFKIPSVDARRVIWLLIGLISSHNRQLVMVEDSDS